MVHSDQLDESEGTTGCASEAAMKFPNSNSRARTRGFSLALLGVILVTPDAVCVRLAKQSGRGTFWWIITFKCFFTFVMISAFMLCQHGWRKLPAGGVVRVQLTSLSSQSVTSASPLALISFDSIFFIL